MRPLIAGGLAALTLGAAVACGTTVATPIMPTYDAVCVDPTTQMRVDDSWCSDAPTTFTASGTTIVFVDHHHAGWYYYDTRSTVVIASMGGRVTGGGWNSPRTTNINSGNTTINNITINRGGVSPQGGKASTVVVKKGTSSTTPPKATTNPNVSRGGFGVKTTAPAARMAAPSFTKKSR